MHDRRHGRGLSQMIGEKSAVAHDQAHRQLFLRHIVPLLPATPHMARQVEEDHGTAEFIGGFTSWEMPRSWNPRPATRK